jgi:hypothetical protein
MKLIFKDKYLRTVFCISLVVLLVVFVLICSKFLQTQKPIIIHFDAYKGIDFLGSRIDVFGILLSAATIFLINMFLAEFLFYRERFLSYFFGASTLFFTILILIVVASIVSVN